MITFEEWLHSMALMPTTPHTPDPEAPTRKTTGQAHRVISSMHHLTCHTDAKDKSFCTTKCNKAPPANSINLTNAIQSEHLLCKELNLKALSTSCIELSYNTCKTNKAVINTHKKKVENAMKDIIKEVVNSLDPAHNFNVSI